MSGRSPSSAAANSRALEKSTASVSIATTLAQASISTAIGGGGGGGLDASKMHSAVPLAMAHERTIVRGTPEFDADWRELTQGLKVQDSYVSCDRMADWLVQTYKGSRTPAQWLRKVVIELFGVSVSQRLFLNIWQGFGPLAALVDNLAALLERPWFFNVMAPRNASRYLKGCVPGTFVVHFAAPNRFNEFTVQYVPSSSGPAADSAAAASGKPSSGSGISAAEIEPQSALLRSNYPEVGFSAVVDNVVVGSRESLVLLVESLRPCVHPMYHPYVDQLWFHGNLDNNGAVEALQNSPNGTFLIRFSSRTNGYTLSIRSDKARGTASSKKAVSEGVIHSRLTVERGLVISEADGNAWPTMKHFVNSLERADRTFLESKVAYLLQFTSVLFPMENFAAQFKVRGMPDV
jgi:hypothetical protein